MKKNNLPTLPEGKTLVSLLGRKQNEVDH